MNEQAPQSTNSSDPRSTSDIFHIEFGKPIHGWMKLRVRLGDQSYEDSISEVLYDSIGTLVRALTRLLRGDAKHATIEFFLEPDVALLYFELFEENVHVTLSIESERTVTYGQSSRQLSQLDRTIIFDGLIPTRKFYRTLLTALGNLWSLHQKGEYDDVVDEDGGWRNWRFDFPEESYLALKSLMKSIPSLR